MSINRFGYISPYSKTVYPDFVTVDKDSEIKRNLTVDGDFEVKGDITFDGDAEVKGDLTVDGKTTLADDATVTNSKTVTTPLLAVSGAATGNYMFQSYGDVGPAVIKCTGDTDGKANAAIANDIKDADLNTVYAWRIGSRLFLEYRFSQDDPSGNGGSGDYLVQIPNNPDTPGTRFQVDLTKITAKVGTAGSLLDQGDGSQSVCGYCCITDGSLQASGGCYLYNSTAFRMEVGRTNVFSAASENIFSKSHFPTDSFLTFSALVELPIT